jgi:hypothetical protein
MVMAVLALAACSSKGVLDVGWERQLGVVDPALSSVQMLSLPTQVRANVAFNITVRTLGSRSCTRAQSTEVTVSGLNVDITPYDEHARTAPACSPAASWPIEHVASVTVSTAGQAHVRLHARTRAGVDSTFDAAFTVTP